MSYNEWLVENTNGTPKQYIEACEQNGWAVDFRDANLYRADLRDANLYGGDLRQAADTDYNRLALAGVVAQNPQHCWEWFIENTPRNVREWALEIMRTWVKAGDILPKELTSALNEQS